APSDGAMVRDFWSPSVPRRCTFSRASRLRSASRGSLTGVLRQAWDGSNLGTLNKADPVTAQEPHVAVLGHVTRTELTKFLGHRRSVERVRQPLSLVVRPTPCDRAIPQRDVGRWHAAGRGRDRSGSAPCVGGAAWEA